MKKIFAVVAVLALVGCHAETRDVKANFAIPEELKDCTFTRMQSEGGSTITVVRCPNSNVSVTDHQKNPVTTITVDGVEYEKK